MEHEESSPLYKKGKMMEIDEIGQTSNHNEEVTKEQHEQEKTIKLHPVRRYICSMIYSQHPS